MNIRRVVTAIVVTSVLPTIVVVWKSYWVQAGHRPSMGVRGEYMFSVETTATSATRHLDSEVNSRNSEDPDTQDTVNMTGCDTRPGRDTAGHMLVVIVSDPAHAERRQYLRQTWARQSQILPLIRFFVGKSIHDFVNKQLEKEAKQFQDICIMQIVDNYAALPLKVFSILVWSLAVPYKFLLKVDDDVLLDTAGLKRLQENVLNNFTDQNVIFGFPRRSSIVHRQGKYSVSSQDFLQSEFPEFVLGIFYILTGKTVRNIVDQGVSGVSVPLEDVVITGVVRDLVGADIVSIQQHMVPSLDYVYGLIKFFGGDLEESGKHLADYSVVHKQFHNVKNVSKESERRIANWIWRKVWKRN